MTKKRANGIERQKWAVREGHGPNGPGGSGTFETDRTHITGTIFVRTAKGCGNNIPNSGANFYTCQIFSLDPNSIILTKDRQ